MARELVEARGETGDPNGAVQGVRDRFLGRRAYLKACGSATVAGLGLGLGPSTAAGDGEYETIVLESGEQRVYELGSGERFGDVLIDQTAAGSMLSLRVAEGANDWTIENVGWKGLAPSGSDRAHTFLLNVRGNGRIENVFIDQRDHSGRPGSDVGGIWTYSDSHHGHIECRHNFIAGCGNNACYASGDGWSHTAATGTIEHYRSYHRDNTVSNFRPGQEDCYIRQCVSVINDPDGTRGGYPSTGSQFARAIWAWHLPNMYVEDTAIWHDPADVRPAEPFWATLRDGSAGSRCELHIIDCDINPSWEEAGHRLFPANAGSGSNGREVDIRELGYEPDVSVLGDGVPTTPEMAAAGRRNLPPELGTAPSGGVGEFESVGGAGSTTEAEMPATDFPYQLQVQHDEPGPRAVYQVEIEGEVGVDRSHQNAILIENVARGGVGPGTETDTLYFDGSVRNIHVDEPAHARVVLLDARQQEVLGVYRHGEWIELTEGQVVSDGSDESASAGMPLDRGGVTVASGIGSMLVSGYILRDRFDWLR